MIRIEKKLERAMQENSLISVIVPVYKVENYLERCVNSIRNQTYQYLEIILVDDGSPDHCGKICDFYAQADSRVKVIHKQNGGLSDARNAGIENSIGEFLAFIDSDDWIDSDMIEILYKMALKYGADIAECSFRSIFRDRIQEETLCTAEQIVCDNITAFQEMLDWRYFKPIACNKLYRRSVLGDVRFPAGRLYEDEFTTYKYIYASEKLVFIDLSKYNYDRIREDSITKAVFQERNLDICDALRERVDFVRQHNLNVLEEKVNNQYLYTLFDRLNKCLDQGITGSRVTELVKRAREDVNYFKTRPVLKKYYEKLVVLSQGLGIYKKNSFNNFDCI